MENKATLHDIDLNQFDEIATLHLEKNYPRIKSEKLLIHNGNKINILKDISYRLSLLIENTFFPKRWLNIIYTIKRFFNQKRVDRKHFLLTSEISNLLSDYISNTEINFSNIENEIKQFKSSINSYHQSLYSFEEKILDNEKNITKLSKTVYALDDSVKELELKFDEKINVLSQENESYQNKLLNNFDSLNSGLHDLRNMLFRNKSLSNSIMIEFNLLKNQMVLDKNNKSKILNKEFYNNLRGRKSEIKSRYLERIEFIIKLYSNESSKNKLKFLDLGCGRGEFMDLIKEKDHTVTGVDECSRMVQICKEKNHDIIEGDILKCMKKITHEKFDIIVMNHVLEHLSINYICDLLPLIRNALKTDGYVIIELPNIHNLFVSSSSFYLDPTHNTKIPLELMTHLFKAYDFRFHYAEFINHSDLHRNILESKHKQLDERFYSNDLLFIAKK